MKFPQLKSRALFAVGATLCAATLAGCGGGGGGGSSSGPATPTATPATSVRVTVQLRDSTGAPVEGLVALDGQRRATTGGNADFANVRIGSLTASAEVNGATYSKSFVATSGANTVQIAVNPVVVNPNGGTPPPAPF